LETTDHAVGFPRKTGPSNSSVNGEFGSDPVAYKAVGSSDRKSASDGSETNLHSAVPKGMQDEGLDAPTGQCRPGGA